MEPQSQDAPKINPLAAPLPSTDETTKREEINAILKPLRTYERDVADMIRSHQVSEVSVNLAEVRRKEFEEKIKAEANAVPAPVVQQNPVASVSSPSSSAMSTITAQSVGSKFFPNKVQVSAPIATPSPAQKRQYFLLPEEHHSHTALFTTLSIILIFIGIGILAWLYFLKTENPVVKTQPVVISTFIPNDQEKVIDITGLSITQTSKKMSSFLDDTYPKDSVTYIKILGRSASTTSEANADAFFESFAPNIPASLTRAFNKKMFAGIYTLEKNHAFFIVQIDSYDKAFEGMLAWEKTMYADVAPFIHKPVPVQTAGTDTAGTAGAEMTGAGGTTTPSGAATSTNGVVTPPPVAVPLANFEDVIVQNKDTRVLRDNQGEILVIYSFIDQKTLFIVDNEDTFKEVLRRYEASKLIR